MSASKGKGPRDKRAREAEAPDQEFLMALESTLSEWDSENDERAYRDL